MPTDDYKPQRAAQAQARCEQTARGDTYYILHNRDANTYVEIDAPNYFLWERMDGAHTLADLALAYLNNFGALPFERLAQLLDQLRANALLENAAAFTPTPPARADAPAHAFARKLARLADTAFQREFVWRRADEFFTAFYRRIGWIYFTRAARVALCIIAIVGFACFVYVEPMETFGLVSIGDSYGAGMIVLTLANFAVLFWHESGHGLTCKFFGRHIHKAGLMFYFGVPAFFVDASDMWMAARVPRILVSLAGPFVNVILGGALAMVVVFLPPSLWTQIFFQAAYIAYLGALLNLNPLLELDGYYVLMDWLEMPQLRQRAFTFVRTGLIAKLRAHTKWTREEIIFGVYGTLAFGFTALMVAVALYIWESEVKLMWRDLATGQDALAVVLLGGLTFAAGASLALGLVARGMLFASTLRERWRVASKGGRASR